MTTQMFFFQYEVEPKETNPDKARYGGGMVNCWIKRATQTEAEAVARGWIGDEDWRIIRLTDGGPIDRAWQEKYPAGLQYFEQAEIDNEVFVFFTYPR